MSGMSCRIKCLIQLMDRCLKPHHPALRHVWASSQCNHSPATRSYFTENTAEHWRPTRLTPSYIQVRHKFDKRGRKNAAAANDDDEDDDADILDDFKDLQGGKDNKVTKVKVSSLRTDLLIKSGLGLARNKVEAAFYDSKIRINGKKVPKKSAPIKTGDEIDVIKEPSPVNPANIVVARIEVLSVQPNTDDITVVLRRYKSLTIENYAAENGWRQHGAE